MKGELLLHILVVLVALLMAALVWMLVANILDRDAEASAAAVVPVEDEVPRPREVASPPSPAGDNDAVAPAAAQVIAPATGPMPHAVYVWQRRWDAETAGAVDRSASRVSRYMVLSAEVSWQRGRPKVFRPTVDYAALRATGKPVGLVVRIEPYRGRFLRGDRLSRTLSRVILLSLSKARAGGVEPVEVQVDYDCAESKLDGYRLWIETFREAVRPTPLTITTLPVWLKHAAFARLVHQTDGYVLQVHSESQPPKGRAAFCDPVAARRWVSAASRVGVSFRVALPTYGRLGVFYNTRSFVGYANSSSRRLPGTTLRPVQADPFALSKLVADLDERRPAHMLGFVWYRLPVPADTLNWTWTTLAVVMDGKTPERKMTVALTHRTPTRVDVELVNDGTVDLPSRVRIGLLWTRGTLESVEPVSGFGVTSRSTRGITLTSSSDGNYVRVAPGERLKAATLRFTRRTTVTGTAEPVKFD